MKKYITLENKLYESFLIIDLDKINDEILPVQRKIGGGTDKNQFFIQGSYIDVVKSFFPLVYKDREDQKTGRYKVEIKNYFNTSSLFNDLDYVNEVIKDQYDSEDLINKNDYFKAITSLSLSQNLNTTFYVKSEIANAQNGIGFKNWDENFKKFIKTILLPNTRLKVYIFKQGDEVSAFWEFKQDFKRGLTNRSTEKNVSEIKDIVLITDSVLRQIIFKSFTYVLKVIGEEKVLVGNKIKDTVIEDRSYKGLTIEKYFGFETLLGLFELEQSPENLESSGTARFFKEKITILENENVYFTSQWNGSDNGRGLSLENFNKFLLDVSNNKIKIIKEGGIYKLIEISLTRNLHQNIIYFGSPGTGKSHKAVEITSGQNVQKVTFHPDYDYHSFVGGYKPSMEGDKITYKFIPQIFTKIYVDAWKNLKSGDVTKPFYLQIEEINRGNCAEIFGDLFQLLDRDKYGFSRYAVTAEEELYRYLISDKGFGGEHEGIKDGQLRFPSNLKIIATMNTSDQSLFPMDSAFKRRWDWIYVPIEYNCPSSDFIIQLDNGKAFKWLSFLKVINDEIFEITKSQDKQIGNWFVDAQNSGNVISESTFVNKVVFYLWNDVFKDEENTVFKSADSKNLTYASFFESGTSNNLVSYILEERFKLIDVNKEEPTTTGEE